MLESEIESWVIAHPQLLGFDRIEKIPEMYGRYHRSTFGDCLGFKSGKVYRIEVETDTSGFFIHKPEVRDKIDVVICISKSEPGSLEKRRELETKTVIKLWDFPLFQHFYRQLHHYPQFGEEEQKEIEDVFGKW